MSKNKHKDKEPEGEYGLIIRRNENGSITAGPMPGMKNGQPAIHLQRALAQEYIEFLNMREMINGVVKGVTQNLMRQAGIVGAPFPNVGSPPKKIIEN